MPLVEKVPKPAAFPHVPFIDRMVDLRVVLRNKSYGSKVHRTFEAPRPVCGAVHLQARPRRGAEAQFLASKSKAASGANDVSPFLDVDAVPFHRLGSAMSVLHDIVASCDATDKLKVELTNASEPRRRSFLSVVFAPFRSFAGSVSVGVA